MNSIEKENRVVKLVKEFNRISPVLSSFASAISGRKLTVKAGLNTYTDGKFIYIRPPEALAHRPMHEAGMCGIRDGIKLVCPGCDRIENIYFLLQHEMAHNIFGTMDEIDSPSYQQLKDIAQDYGNQEFFNNFIKLLDNKYKDQSASCMKISNDIGKPFATICNLFEDYRCERNVGMVRSGFTEMSYYMSEDILQNGVDGHSWQKDADRDNQISAMWLFDAQDHDISQHFDSDMVNHINQFNEVFDRNTLQSSVDSIYASVKFIAFMNKLGYFYDLFQDENEEDSGESDDNADSNAENGEEDKGDSQGTNSGGQSSSSDVQGSPEKDSGTGERDSKDESGDNGSEDFSTGKKNEKHEQASKQQVIEILTNACGISHDHDSSEHKDQNHDEVPDDVLVVVINQVENWDEYSFDLGGLELYNKKSRPKSFFMNEARDIPDATNLGPSVLHARRIFSDSKLDKNYHGIKKGKLDGQALGKRAWSNDERLFKRKIRAQGISSEVCIGLDISYSTNYNGSIKQISEIGYYVSNLLDKLGVTFSVFAHSTEYTKNRDGLMQSIVTIKDVNDKWDNNSKDRVLSIAPCGGSLDGHNLEFYRKKLQASRANRKLLIYFTDGQIPETCTDIEIPILQREIGILKKSGIAMLGVGMYTDSPKNVGMDTVLVKDSKEIKTVLNEIEKRIANV